MQLIFFTVPPIPSQGDFAMAGGKKMTKAASTPKTFLMFA